MTPPVCTYRLQFRGAMTFEAAARLAPYLARLGVSHLYASPLFAAVPGSTHGYDGIDFATIEPAIGGEEGFGRLAAALDRAGLGLLLDFVPNHMAAHELNDWWRAVLEWGAKSPYAGYFDIDWSEPKLIVPILAAPYGEVLQAGEFGLRFDADAGTFTFTCYDRRLPLTPPSYERLLAPAAHPGLDALARRFAEAGVENAETLKRQLADMAAAPECRAAIDAALAATVGDRPKLHAIHEAQVWRLTDWRLARVALTFRRFFEIAGLVCLRVEDPEVFAAAHARLLELIASGRVAGVRFDHIDGLADPKVYLERFRRALPETRECFVVVEKILEGSERLREDWPVDGTTGYEFIARLADLFVDHRREADMTRAYDAFTARQTDYAAAALAAKREILERNLAAELAVLTERASRIARADPTTRDFGADTLRRAIVAFVAALPVYRTYVDEGDPDDRDCALITEAARQAGASRVLESPAAAAFIERLLRRQFDRPDLREAARAFTTRLQQTTGAVMAKALEDTVFYRFNRLIALNEVGGAPQQYGAPLADFHAAMAARQAAGAAGLSATATHDTKRGEDARARIYVLSEMPDAWHEAVRRWSALNRPWRRDVAGGPAPEPAIEWLFYQALLGAWPADLTLRRPLRDDDAQLTSLRARLLAYMEKAVREAKMRTSWAAPDTNYEEAVAGFVAAALSAERGRDFLVDFVETCRPIWLAGAINGLAQVAIKLAAPGVPDIYQGAELWDFSLVDPDNRAPVDFAQREELMSRIDNAEPARLLAKWRSGLPKLALTVAALRARAERPALFADGDHVGLATTGQFRRHAIAFARVRAGAFALTITPRFALALTEGAEQPIVPADRWGDTAVVLSQALRGRTMTDIVTGARHEARDRLPLAALLSDFPVAVLRDAG